MHRVGVLWASLARPGAGRQPERLRGGGPARDVCNARPRHGPAAPGGQQAGRARRPNMSAGRSHPPSSPAGAMPHAAAAASPACMSARARGFICASCAFWRLNGDGDDDDTQADTCSDLLAMQGTHAIFCDARACGPAVRLAGRKHTNRVQHSRVLAHPEPRIVHNAVGASRASRRALAKQGLVHSLHQAAAHCAPSHCFCGRELEQRDALLIHSSISLLAIYIPPRYPSRPRHQCPSLRSAGAAALLPLAQMPPALAPPCWRPRCSPLSAGGCHCLPGGCQPP